MSVRPAVRRYVACSLGTEERMKKALFGLMCCSAVLVFNACNDSEDEKTDEINED